MAGKNSLRGGRLVADLPLHQRFGVPAGVARTALYMSLIRQHESGRRDALFRDPFSGTVVAELAGSRELEELAAGLGAPLTPSATHWANVSSGTSRYGPVISTIG
jgi:hypothetical protein